MGTMTLPAQSPPSVADLIEFHSAYGEDIEFDDADRNTYTQSTCQCGTPLGIWTLEEHRALEVQTFLNARLAESFLVVRNQLQQLANDMASEAIPTHLRATLDQIIVENSLRVGLKNPEVEKRSAALRKAVQELGLPHGVDFFNPDGSATFIWQQVHHRVTVYVTHDEPYEVEDVPEGPLVPFTSADPERVAAEVLRLLEAGKDAG